MPPAPESGHQRFNQIAEAHLSTAWRVARRCGISLAQIDDVVQEVFIVVNRRLADITVGREAAFVAGAAARVAANCRRANRRRLEEPIADHEVLSVSPDSLELLARQQELELLDAALTSMTDGQREVFVLTELEQLTAVEVSEQLDIPVAAVVSRLRRSREAFKRFCDGMSALERPTRRRSIYV